LPLPQWSVPAAFLLVSLAVVFGAKQLWVKGFGVLFGLIFLQVFLSAFLRDSTAVTLTFVVALLLLAAFIARRRIKGKKKEDEKKKGGMTVNVYQEKRRK
jgi:membrane protein implicated in regulation of membrane protease activity